MAGREAAVEGTKDVAVQREGSDCYKVARDWLNRQVRGESHDRL